jgi:hypothetical protein
MLMSSATAGGIIGDPRPRDSHHSSCLLLARVAVTPGRSRTLPTGGPKGTHSFATHMKNIALLLLALAAPAPLLAQEPQSRAVATTLGILAGAAGGGYVTVAVVVTEARFGLYIHDIDDVLGWRSAPFLIGSLAGGGLGFYNPERLQGAVVYGAGGLVLGGLAGLAIGSAIWEPPEGRWAGAAIGAGVGLIIGNIVGILNPVNLFTNPEDEGAAAAAGVPVMIRIRL